MSDIELKLDGLEEEDEKLDQILKAEPEKIENRVVFTESEEKMIDEFSKKNRPRQHQHHPPIRFRCPKEDFNLLRENLGRGKR